VPGKLRWSTTAIARFDADIDWPTDLCFDLVLNRNLKSFDGLGIAADSYLPQRRFITSPVSWGLSYVRSELASNLTGGKWSSQLFDKSNAHEVPSDAIVYLSFSSDLDHSLAFASLRKANADIYHSCGARLPYNCYHSCGARCLAISPRGLLNAQKYELKFPVGGMYSKVAGTAGKELKVSMTGLVPFSFPFFYATVPRDSWKNKKLMYRRHQLYLRHGFAQGSTADQLAKLKASVSVTFLRACPSVCALTPVSFRLSLIDKSTLQIDLQDTMPNTRYTIKVAANSNIKDGFQQPLQASQMEFDTADWPSKFVVAWASTVRFANFSGGWTALSQGKNNKYRDYNAKGRP